MQGAEFRRGFGAKGFDGVDRSVDQGPQGRPGEVEGNDFRIHLPEFFLVPGCFLRISFQRTFFHGENQGLCPARIMILAETGSGARPDAGECSG